MPDQTLTTASEEIKAILDRHDLAAVVILHSPGTILHMHALSPSWSCAWIDALGEFRIRALRADFASDEEQRQAVERTVSMLLGLLSQSQREVEMFTAISDMLAKTFDIQHTEKLEG